MHDFEMQVAKKYILPERPFLYGMASAFDIFGVLSQGNSEVILLKLQAESGKPNQDFFSSAWSDVGESLYLAIKQYESASGEIIR